MAFIPNAETLKLGDWVELTKNVKVLSGTFTKGTQMRIVSEDERGFTLVDNEGNYLRETRLVEKYFKKI